MTVCEKFCSKSDLNLMDPNGSGLERLAVSEKFGSKSDLELMHPNCSG